MIQKLKALKDFVNNTFRKKTLRRNVLFLSLSGVLLTFFIMMITAPLFLFFLEDFITNLGTQLVAHATPFMEKLYQKQTESYLREEVAIRSALINEKLEKITEDVKDISSGMEEILKNQSYYLPRYLPDPRQEYVPPGKAYVHFSKRTLGNLPPTVMDELYLASNVEDFLVSHTKADYSNTFSDFLVVSEKGYVIGIDYSGDDPSEEELDELDYQMKSKWYKAVKETGKVFFTEPSFYKGNYFLHCGAPYYDSDGNFAGGVGVGTEVNYLHSMLVSLVSNEEILDYADRAGSIIVNQNGKIIMSSDKEGILAVSDKDMRLDEDEATANVVKRMVAMENDVVSNDWEGKRYYVAFAPIKIANWSFAMIIESSIVNSAADTAKNKISTQTDEFKTEVRQKFFYIILFSLSSILIMMVIILRLNIRESNKFLKPLQELISGVQDISKGNFNRRLEVTSEDEIGDLANAVNTMSSELKTYMTDLTKVTSEKERIATELNVATNIQLSALPHDFLTERSEFDIYATMKAAKEVGGDFYDFYLVGEKHLVITIADVSGKGVPAALFMMKGKTILKNLAMMMKNPDDLAAVMALANQQLCQGNDEMMFITVFLAMLDLETGKLIYVNGGHNPPVLYRDNEKTFRYIDVEQNCVLGLMDEIDFEQQETQLNHGDIFYMYTDGVTEAMSETKEQYGEARLEKCLNGIDHQCELSTLLSSVSKSLAEHVQQAEQSDDITMLAVRFIGK